MEQRLTNMQMIDNVEGISMNAAGETRAEKYVKMSDVHIYGKTAGKDDRCRSTLGMEIGVLVNGAKALHPLAVPMLPIPK